MPRWPSLPTVIRGGDRRESLVAVRDHLAKLLVVATPRDAAALTKQLTDVMRELDGLPVAKEVSRVDDLARRRAARRAEAASGEPAPGEDVSGS